MALDLSVYVDLVFRLIQDNDNIDLSTPRDSMTISKNDSLENGTGSSQADVQWHDQRTLAGTSENIDLAGSLTSTLDSSTITFANVKAVLIKNNSTTATEQLTVGGASSNAWDTMITDTVIVGPDGVCFLYSPIDGFAVTAGTGDILKITASSGDTITYDIVVIGTSA